MKHLLSWKLAIQVPGFKRNAEAATAGWPDAISPENIVRLQFPWEGSKAEKKHAIDRQCATLDLMNASISDGSLPAVERTRTEPVLKQVPDTWFSLNPGSQLGSSAWLARDAQSRMKTVKAGERDVTYLAIEAPAFRAWLSACEKEPSEHIRAWFEAVAPNAETLEAHRSNAQARPTPGQSDSPGDVLERILCECERRAAACGEPFRVDDMPGQIKQLWELCKRLEPVFHRQTSIDSFKRYTRPARCRWSTAAKANPDATPLYQKLFPEAWKSGATKSEERKKA